MRIDDLLKYIGKNVSRIRKMKALSQKVAADKSGVSYRYYQSIETGRANITISTLLRIAKFYQIQPSDLLVVKP